MKEKPGFLEFYEGYKELIHVIGFLILVVFTVGGAWAKGQVWAADVEDLKSRTSRLELVNAQILQNLQDTKENIQDIKNFLRVPPHRN